MLDEDKILKEEVLPIPIEENEAESKIGENIEENKVKPRPWKTMENTQKMTKIRVDPIFSRRKIKCRYQQPLRTEQTNE